MKVLLLTDNQLDKLEFILNRFFDNYLFIKSETLDSNEENILTVTVDKRMTSKEAVTNKHVINSTKLKRFYSKLSTTQKNKIKSRFSNVNLRTWVLSHEVNFSSVTINDPI